MSAPRLAIVIVTHNSARFIAPCLDSLASRAGAIDLETVLVDASSTDGTPDLVERGYPDARVVRVANRGYAAALNVGIEVTSAPFVLLANPDIELVEGELAALVDRLDELEDVGIAGINQVDADGLRIPTIRRSPSPLRTLADALGAERLPGVPVGERELRAARYGRETECAWTSGSIMLCRREALETVGGLDESFFLYCEETDLALRLAGAGWRTVHLPGATAIHFEKASSGRDPSFEAQAAAARLQFARKHLGRWGRRGLRAALIVRYLLRVRNAGARRGLSVALGLAGAPFGTPERSTVHGAASRAMVG